MSIYDQADDPVFSLQGNREDLQRNPEPQAASHRKGAYRRLAQLHSATKLEDLRSPGNSLEALTGDREGQHSIRVNDQYRLCFVWNEGDATDAEIVDYH